MLVQSLVPNQIDILNFADVGWAKMMCPMLFFVKSCFFGAECHVFSETFSHL
jgi:hypothetical protein